MCGDTQISCSVLRETTERLSMKDEQTGKTGFEVQLHVSAKCNIVCLLTKHTNANLSMYAL